MKVSPGLVTHGAQAADTHFVGDLVERGAVGQLLLIGTALEAAHQLHPVADFQVGGVARGAAPGDAGNVIAFAIGTVHSQHQVRDLTAKGRGAVAWGLAQRTGQLHAVGVFFVLLAVENPLGKRGDQKPAGTLDNLVVAAQLSFQAQHAARRQRLVDQQPLADGDGQKVLRPAQARHAQGGHVELLAEQLVPELQALADLTPQMDDVSRFFHVAHLMSCFGF